MSGALDREWARVLDLLRAEFGEAAFRSWLQPLTVTAEQDGEVSLAVPTRFIRDWIIKNYADRIQSLWAIENPAVTSIDLVVVPGMGAGAAEAEAAKPAVETVEPAPRPAPARKSAVRVESTETLDSTGAAAGKAGPFPNPGIMNWPSKITRVHRNMPNI